MTLQTGYSVERINGLSAPQFVAKFERISLSKRWVGEMLKARPFRDPAHILETAAHIWWNVCSKADWIEAFNGRPLIGDQESFAKDLWCAVEDAHTIAAPKRIADELIACNKPYLDKFGYVWILLCEGLTPEQQLWNYRRRIENDVETELRENCVEELKVTMRRLRLSLLDQDPYEHPELFEQAVKPDAAAGIKHVVCESVTKPLPLYTHMTVHAGVAYVSGVQGFIPQTFDFPSRDAGDQARQVLRNLETILAQAGSALDKVLKISVFLTDIADLAKVEEALKASFPGGLPAMSAVAVPALPRDAKVVVEAVAAAD